MLDGPLSVSRSLLDKRRTFEQQQASRQQTQSAQRCACCDSYFSVWYWCCTRFGRVKEAKARAEALERQRREEQQQYVLEAEAEARRLKEEMQRQKLVRTGLHLVCRGCAACCGSMYS